MHLLDPVQGKQSPRQSHRVSTSSRRSFLLWLGRKTWKKIERDVLIFHHAPSHCCASFFWVKSRTLVDIGSTEFEVFLQLFVLSIVSCSSSRRKKNVARHPPRIVRFWGTKTTRPTVLRFLQLEMPCKQNRYLILTKPRPHKRIFSDSRWFCNESPSRSPPLSPFPFVLCLHLSAFLPVAFSAICLSSSLCLVSAT